ncbi:hypothetical protein EVAR_5874_1 [Eumeta japonica]|uniref:Uncharacterized protein n=1 Tax=Eumeta variegata TaxID=151549 RepID=A0A4C1TCV4_EUMVA|nr:hypothetical protein EVAR_5874_1 [Eumeta japonica]
MASFYFPRLFSTAHTSLRPQDTKWQTISIAGPMTRKDGVLCEKKPGLYVQTKVPSISCSHFGAFVIHSSPGFHSERSHYSASCTPNHSECSEVCSYKPT